MPSDMRNYRRVVAILKQKFPEYHVSVRRVRLGKYVFGDCNKVGKNKFLIRIKNSLPSTYAIDILLHEWAHVLAWHSPGEDHGMNWGKAYSKVYRVFEDEFLEEKSE